MTFAELRIDTAILTCAISAGIHGALVEDHFREGAGAGVGFVIATALLAVLTVTLTHNPSPRAFIAATAVFIGLIASYGLSISTGLPVLHPDVEAVDGLALLTKVVEAVGAVTAASLVRRPSLAGALTQPKGTLS